MHGRNYVSGLITGGVLGAALGWALLSRQKPNRKLLRRSGMKKAGRVLRGFSEGVTELLHR